MIFKIDAGGHSEFLLNLYYSRSLPGPKILFRVYFTTIINKNEGASKCKPALLANYSIKQPETIILAKY